MRIAFFGSPAFAVPVLEALAARHDVILAVTQPDRPAGRGMKLHSPAAAVRARELEIPLAQPQRVRGNREFHDLLRAAAPDVCVTAAYGQILPQSILDIPEHGFLNVHGSLLPRWRGAAPVQWALISGDPETGISIMQTDAGMDTGPVRLQWRTPVGSSETATELFDRLAPAGAETMVRALELLEAGQLPLVPQDEDQATHARMLVRDDGLLDFSRPATDSWNRYRGVHAWPGTFFRHAGNDIKVHTLQPGPSVQETLPGTVAGVSGDGVLVACGQGSLLLTEVQAPGRKRVSAREWADAAGISAGSVI